MSYVGGIAGEVSTTISNATNQEAINGISYVGGIAGKADGIKSSTNNGNISLNTTSGSSGSYFGGIVGHASGTSYNDVSGCTNSGTVNAGTAGSNVGGIAGYGNVYSSRNEGNVVGGNNTGGIVGSGTVKSSTLTFNGGTTQSTAMVIGSNNVGGIVGNYLGDGGFDSNIYGLSNDGTGFIAVGNNSVGALIGYDSTNIYSNGDSSSQIKDLCGGLERSILGHVASKDYDGTNGLVGNSSATLATRKTTDPANENKYTKDNNGTLSYLITKELKS